MDRYRQAKRCAEQNERQGYPQSFFPTDTQLAVVPVPNLPTHPTSIIDGAGNKIKLQKLECVGDTLTGENLGMLYLKYVHPWGHFHYAKVDGLVYLYGEFDD